MTIQRRTTGTGLTQKTTYEWDEEEDRADPGLAAALEDSTLEGLFENVETQSFAIMESAGLPTSYGSWMYDRKGNWRLPAPPFAGRITVNIWPIAKARGHAEDDDVGFASRMLDSIYWARRSMQEGDHEWAMMHLYWLGVQRAEQRLKAEREALYLRGVEDKQAKIAGGAATAKTTAPRRVEVWLRYMQITGGKRTESDRLAAEELGDGESTVRGARLAWEKTRSR